MNFRLLLDEFLCFGLCWLCAGVMHDDIIVPVGLLLLTTRVGYSARVGRLWPSSARTSTGRWPLALGLDGAHPAVSLSVWGVRPPVGYPERHEESTNPSANPLSRLLGGAIRIAVLGLQAAVVPTYQAPPRMNPRNM